MTPEAIAASVVKMQRQAKADDGPVCERLDPAQFLVHNTSKPTGRAKAKTAKNGARGDAC